MDRILKALKLYLLAPVSEVFRLQSANHRKFLVFLFLPVFYFINLSIIHRAYGFFYLGILDPEYFHMFNGLAIAKGNLGVEYIAHPGTPLEFIFAFAARIIHFVQSSESLYSDFINDPEKYIHAAMLLQNLIICIVLYTGSLKIFSYTNSYSITFAFQLIPVGNSFILEISGRLIPESTLLIPVFLLVVLIIKHIYKTNETSNSDLLKWAMVVGFGIACKLSFIPVFILPLLLLKSTIKQKIQYSLYTALSVAVFAYPIVFNFSKFWDWVSGMATHSGKWGAGDSGLVDTKSLIPDFTYLFREDKLFFLLIILSTVLLALWFWKSKSNNTGQVERSTRSIIAVNLTLILATLFTLKHFALHYFMPFYAFKFVLILLMFLLIKAFIPHRWISKISSVLFIFLLLAVAYGQKPRLTKSLTAVKERANTKKENALKINGLVNPESPLIIAGAFYGSPFMAQAQAEGFMMAYKQKNGFKQFLQEKHPNTYMFYGWTSKFYHFDDFLDFNQILSKRPANELYVFTGEKHEEAINTIEERFYSVVDTASLKKEVLYSNSLGEKLYHYAASDTVLTKTMKD